MSSEDKWPSLSRNGTRLCSLRFLAQCMLLYINSNLRAGEDRAGRRAASLPVCALTSCCRSPTPADTMRCFIRHFFRVSVALMVLWFLIVLHVPEENKDVKTMVTILWDTGSMWWES